MLAVTGILLGLLAMHAVDLKPSTGSPAGHSHSAADTPHAQSEASVASGVSAESVPAPAQDGSDCTGGMCAADCLALGMACAMALLTVALFRRRRASGGWILQLAHLVDFARIIPRRTIGIEPPSLTVLSISRT
ncbi:DUF6153 family protein [Marisediminicola senii]|uniref:DUF6153 family protein n=1 Tax=Marisediminicola senii TaxID=2711233 RepID=UPI0038B345E9